MPSKQTLSVVIHNVRSAHNVGAIFRTADAVGVEKIYLGGYSPTPIEPRVGKTALGAEQTVPWEQYKQTWLLLKKLRQRGIEVIALEQTPQSKNIFTYRPRRSIALLVGHERKGLSSSILQYTDTVLAIPMYGKKESLNVS